MKRLLFLGVSVCLLASGCFDSEKPLSDPKTAKLDERLAGIWQEADKDHVTYYHVGQAGDKFPKGVMRAVSITHQQGQVKTLEFLLFPTTLGDKQYLNVVWASWLKQREEFEKKADWSVVPFYNICQYHVDGDKLSLRIIDGKAKEQAIKSGKIKGIKKENSTEYTFTDTTENLARFFTESGDNLFTEKPCELERVKLDKL